MAWQPVESVSAQRKIEICDESDDMEAHEIVQSESEESIEKKKETYPCPVFVHRIEDVLKGGF